MQLLRLINYFHHKKTILFVFTMWEFRWICEIKIEFKQIFAIDMLLNCPCNPANKHGAVQPCRLDFDNWKATKTDWNDCCESSVPNASVALRAMRARDFHAKYWCMRVCVCVRAWAKVYRGNASNQNLEVFSILISYVAFVVYSLHFFGQLNCVCCVSNTRQKSLKIASNWNRAKFC